MIKINFDKLLLDYNDQLGIKLRGDRSNLEYLQFWVPNENLVESLLNLIDSLKETNNLDFEIEIDLKKFDSKSISDFKNIISKIGNFSLKKNGNNLNFLIELNLKNYNNYFKADLKEKRIIKAKKKDQINEIKPIYENKLIHPDYIDAITQVFKQEKDLSNNFVKNKEVKNCKNYKKKIDIGELQLNYSEDLTNFEISLALNEKNLKEKPLLDKVIFILNIIIKEMNFTEIKHHSLIYFTDKLLEVKNSNNAAGIIHPENVGKIFYEIKNFYIDAGSKILEKKNFVINKTYPELKISWLKKTSKDQNELINKEIGIFCEKKNLEKDSIILIELKDSFRVEVKYTDSIKTSSKEENYFLSLERFLKGKIDFRLEVFTIGKNDDNKLRVKNLK